MSQIGGPVAQLQVLRPYSIKQHPPRVCEGCSCEFSRDGGLDTSKSLKTFSTDGDSHV